MPHLKSAELALLPIVYAPPALTLALVSEPMALRYTSLIATAKNSVELVGTVSVTTGRGGGGGGLRARGCRMSHQKAGWR